MITASIVTYHNNFEDLEAVINSFLNTNLDIKLYISDNSSNEKIKELCNDDRIEYTFNNGNLGFGKAHNVSIRKALKKNSKYHLILNPDITFNGGVLEELLNYMELNNSVGLIMPKILYPTGEIQKLTKLLPTPMNLIFRKFCPIKKYIDKLDYKYEMRFSEYNKEMEVPYLSGCFMFVRTEIFKEVGYFDENFFMYLEDTDLSRRIHEKYKTIYYPKVQINHKFAKGSYVNKKLLMYHIKSAIYYFNKWGWFFDKKRKEVNSRILKEWGIN